MHSIRSVALGAGAALGMAFLAACSDSTTAPVGNVVIPKTSFAVGDVTNPPATPQVGKIFLCKEGNVGGAFTFGRTTEGPAVDPTGSKAANQTLANGKCLEVANDLSVSGSGSHITITEGAAPANTQQSVTGCTFIGKDLNGVLQAPVACSYSNGGDLFINSFHGYVITYTNTFTAPPPPEVCDFSTFGGFVLTPNNISYGGNAGRIEDGFAYGDLNFKNHTNGDHIHVWNVTDYGHPATGPLSEFEDSRLAFGLGSVNGGPVNVPVEFRFLDSGEPAKKDGDRVWLSVGGVVLITEQEVDGGNIQLHSKCKNAPKAEKH